MNRNQISEEDAKIRISAQMSEEFKISKSDFVIKNDSDIKNLEKQVDEILENLLSW